MPPYIMECRPAQSSDAFVTFSIESLQLFYMSSISKLLLSAKHSSLMLPASIWHSSCSHQSYTEFPLTIMMSTLLCAGGHSAPGSEYEGGLEPHLPSRHQETEERHASELCPLPGLHTHDAHCSPCSQVGLS